MREHPRYARLRDGEVASYVPELGKAPPDADAPRVRSALVDIGYRDASERVDELADFVRSAPAIEREPPVRAVG